MSTTTLEVATPLEKLAIDGGPKAITAERPENFLLGPNEIGQEEIDAVTAVLKSKELFRFLKERAVSPVAQFEDLFLEKSGAKHALAVNSGTSALIVGLIGIGVSQGDEVLVPAYTYIATAAAILALGAFPVIVEIDSSLTMDPDDIVKKITQRTKAIVPVHMRGKPCDMETIVAIAGEHNLKILEDCAQANGGFYKGKSLGTWGDAGAFSLQHFKIITAGEGGLLATNTKSVWDRAAVYHDSAFTFWMENKTDAHEEGEEGANKWKQNSFLGENYRLSELHGALALEQLKKRDRILEKTRSIKARLLAACQEIPGATMETCHDPDGDCGISLAFFMPTIAESKKIAETLGAEGIPCGTKFTRQIPDRHIFYHWNYIMEKRTPHLNGFPWSATDRPCQVEYTKDMCPQSLDWMERAVLFSITQMMSDEYVDQICAGIRKVAKALSVA